MCTPHRGEKHHVENPRGHMWKPCWRAIPSIQSLEVGLLLANHKDRLDGVRWEMWQIPTIFTSVESPSGRAHFNDHPIVVPYLGDWSNRSTLQRKRQLIVHHSNCRLLYLVGQGRNLRSITTTKIRVFIYKNIIFWLGVPHTIVSDNDTQFDYNEFKGLCDDLQIKVFTSVVRPQTNGQVEVVNKMIKHNLKTKLEDLKGRWANELPEVLWAYRTTARSTTREPHSRSPMGMGPWF